MNNNVGTWKTIGLQILEVHNQECGDGSCGCGCGVPFAQIHVTGKEPEGKASQEQEG